MYYTFRKHAKPDGSTWLEFWIGKDAFDLAYSKGMRLCPMGADPERLGDWMMDRQFEIYNYNMRPVDPARRLT